ncbi:leucine-rich repeat protein kinase family protein [Actinidia rufa]|uniref:non-specific serine/threonine protein kinase n=1 Tax=Actinidia rufa TaxID=165716 RepID=A0A7J0EB85_9ERIC|nr:leucine-rich repeat protein kinase family protein [Actinidia rufa]
MSSWNDSFHFCNWVGVICDPSNRRIKILDLGSQKLVGSIPPSIGNLTFLIGLNLKNNFFQGIIPQEIGRLTRLQHLNLSYNSFGGQIPTNLTHCTNLSIFHAIQNELVGQIPEQLTTLSKLAVLAVDINHISGTIPSSIGNLSSLSLFSFMQNRLQGSIPPEIGLISGLGFFQLYANELSGTVPSSIYNISSLYYFTVVQNKLHGQLPPDVGLTLPNIETFAGGLNNFTGPIPVSLSNASQLRLIDFAENSLTGTVPKNFGILQGLNRINFDDNKLGSGQMGDLDFITYLSNCTSLEVLGLSRNMFGGKFPNSIANLSTNLQILTLGSNRIYGSVPNGIEKLVNLTLLGLEGNYLNGSLPDGVGKLQQLNGLYLNVNGFSGSIPTSFGNLSLLTKLFMEENRLEGSIPPSLGNCNRLLVLNLSSNNLSGTAPKEVMSLSSLSISLALAGNSLTGSLPFEVGKLVNLKELDVSGNKLSGEIPSSLSSCLSLERLVLKSNFLQGKIPESLRDLRGLEEIDFSRNNLSGRIPEFLGKLLLLKKLNLSFNNLEGLVPSEGVFRNASAISLLGNNKLCGGVSDLNLPKCSQDDSHSSRNFLSLKVVIPLTIGIVLSILLCSLAAFYVMKKSTKRPLTRSATEDWQRGMSYAELFNSTNGFSKDNLIGSGSFGSVYKGVLNSTGETVAVKVLNLQRQGASKSFMDEYKALTTIRHRNLLKIISTGSGVDLQGHGFKALVFKFMSNGSLDQWLHPGDAKAFAVFVEMAFPERVMDIVDRSLVFEEEEDIVVDNKNEEAKIEEITMIGNEKPQTDARSGMEDCMVSVLRVGLSCSNAMPRERMLIKVVVNKMHAIRDSLLS